MGGGNGCKKEAPAPRDDTAVGGAGEGNHQLVVAWSFRSTPPALVFPIVGMVLPTLVGGPPLFGRWIFGALAPGVGFQAFAPSLAAFLAALSAAV